MVLVGNARGGYVDRLETADISSPSSLAYRGLSFVVAGNSRIYPKLDYRDQEELTAWNLKCLLS